LRDGWGDFFNAGNDGDIRILGSDGYLGNGELLWILKSTFSR